MGIQKVVKLSIKSTRELYYNYIPFLLVGLFVFCLKLLLKTNYFSHDESMLRIVDGVEGVIQLFISACLLLKIQNPIWAKFKILKYAAFLFPGFLIRNLAFFFTLIIGLAVFIVPGIYVLAFLGLAPFLTLLEPEEYSCFKRSIELCNRDVWTSLFVTTGLLLTGLLDFVVESMTSSVLGVLAFISLALFEFFMLTLVVQLYKHLLDKRDFSKE